MNWKMIAVMVALVTGAAALSGCPPNAIHSLTLIVSPAGTGQIIASPERAGYPAGTIITLEAVPAEGYQFRNWVGTGINNSINPTYLRIYADNTITAVFVREGGAEGEGEGETPPGVVRDGGFEAGSASPAWTQVSTAFEYLICDAAHCGTLDGLGPRSGQYWAYFGNAPDGESEASSLSQTINMPRTGQANLGFHLAVPRAEAPFVFSVSLGRRLLFTTTETDAADYIGYQPVSIDVSDFADGSTATLLFAYFNPAAPGAVIGVFVDDVAVTIPGVEGE